MARSAHRYSTVALALHWGIALLVLAQVILVITADATEGPAAGQYIGLHKAVGLSILMLTLVRIGWRIANPPPPLPADMPRWQSLAAKVTHVLFYVVLIGLPLGGWAASSAGGRDISWFGLFNWPLLPLPLDRDLAGTFMDMHRAGVKVLYALLFLHVAAAFKHGFAGRDNVLHRMIPFIPRKS